MQCRGLCRNALQDEPPKLLPPHAEDPGTPELDQLVLPRGSFDRRELLKLEREVKTEKMTDTEYQWRLRLCMTPTPSASDVRKVKSSISKSKGAQRTRCTRTKGESSTVTSKSQDLGFLRFFFFSCLSGFHWLDPGHMFELVRCLLDFSLSCQEAAVASNSPCASSLARSSSSLHRYFTLKSKATHWMLLVWLIGDDFCS